MFDGGVGIVSERLVCFWLDVVRGGEKGIIGENECFVERVGFSEFLGVGDRSGGLVELFVVVGIGFLLVFFIVVDFIVWESEGLVFRMVVVVLFLKVGKDIRVCIFLVILVFIGGVVVGLEAIFNID